MLIPINVHWDIDCSLYNFGSVFIIALIIWQVKRIHRGLRLGHNRSCCWRHRRLRQKAREAALRARRASQAEAERPWKLLLLIKSHNWLPREGSVRSILCADPGCPTCNDLALEIQQLLQGDSTLVTSSSLGPAQYSSGPENLSEPGMAAPLSDEFSINTCTYLHEYLKLGQDCPLPRLSGNLDTLHPSSLVEPGSPAMQPEKKNNSAAILEKKEAPEAGLRSKMKCLLHWLNPRTGSQWQEQGAVLSKSVTVTKAKQGTAEKSPDVSDSRVGDAKSNQRQGSALQFCQSLIACHHHQCPEHSDPLNCDVQADSRPGISTPGLEDACPKEKARPERKQCMDSQSWATPR
ncbi:protein SPATA31F3-like [Tenrec ecaudatus]|uniref:protein SPATA31F3-like n=1 Tax=Tenrec ecaudatus TaxID=94439 RepID=UPI003F5A2264